MTVARPEADPREGEGADTPAALAEPDPIEPRELPERLDYHLALTPGEVIELLRHDGAVRVVPLASLPASGEVLAGDHRFTAELDGSRFQIHCGAPAARGSSGTGLLPLLYLRGALERSGQGTRVALRFVFDRPRWAGQRRIGFLSLLVCASFWVFLGGGELVLRALFFLGFLAITAPVVVHDLRRGRRIEREKLELLALAERILGPLALEDERRQPYRRRAGG